MTLAVVAEAGNSMSCYTCCQKQRDETSRPGFPLPLLRLCTCSCLGLAFPPVSDSILLDTCRGGSLGWVSVPLNQPCQLTITFQMKIFGEINFPSCYLKYRAAKAHTHKSHCLSHSVNQDHPPLMTVERSGTRRTQGGRAFPMVSYFPPFPASNLYELNLVGIPENVTDSCIQFTHFHLSDDSGGGTFPPHVTLPSLTFHFLWFSLSKVIR